MNITRGKIATAQKVTIYGPEGIGKSTFASMFPNPLFLDIEGSTKHMDVARLPVPSSWTMLIDGINHVNYNPNICETLVLDTADWAEALCIKDFCAKKQLSGIEDLNYGKGYIYIVEEIGRMLNRLDEVIEKGVNVVLTAHATMRKFEQPDEIGAYDRWELKLQKRVAQLVKEWSDMVLFANYKTYSVATDKDGKKHKAQGGQRVMYTTHHPCWDAKNRHNLPDELPFDYTSIAHIFASIPIITTPVTQPTLVSPVQPQNPPILDIAQNVESGPMIYGVETQAQESDYKNLPKALVDLMIPEKVTPLEIQTVVAFKGYYPINTPIQNYDTQFIDGVLISAWPQVLKMILEEREVPF